MKHILSTIKGKKDTIHDFFQAKFKTFPCTVYSSVDIRNAGFKIAPIDANIFPAGFNNMCDIDKETSSEVFRSFIQKTYGNIKTILLLTEDNTRNLFYWDNVYTISAIIKEAGFKCLISMATHMEKGSIITSSGRTVELSDITIENKRAKVDNKEIDLILSNNDFTLRNKLLENIKQPIIPPYKLGWFNRKKSDHLKHYHEVVSEFCDLINLDPWYFSLKVNVVNVDETELENLVEISEKMINNLSSDYNEKDIKSEPFLFIKNNSGTYGMGVIPIKNPKDILDWTKKQKAKIKTGKLGSKVNELIVQEGVPSCIKTDEGYIAEPVIYMIGEKLVGGFLRTHGNKTIKDNLNSPGSVFKKYCMTDIENPSNGIMMENMYGIIAKLSAVAISMEAKN